MVFRNAKECERAYLIAKWLNLRVKNKMTLTLIFDVDHDGHFLEHMLQIFGIAVMQMDPSKAGDCQCVEDYLNTLEENMRQGSIPNLGTIWPY
jgi:hypothetical protein